MTLITTMYSSLGDSTAPVLSSATAGTPTSDGCTGAGVTTNEGNGTLYWAVVTNGGSCTDAQLKAGSGGNIVSGKAGNQAVTTTGAQTIADITGLTASTVYQIKFLQRDTGGNDSAQASANLTTAAASDPYFASVVVLAVNDNAADGTTTFIDQSSSPKTLTANGNAQYDTAQAPTGMTSSMLTDGTADYVSSAASAAWQMGTGDFTVELYIRPTGVQSFPGLIVDFRRADLNVPFAVGFQSARVLGVFNGSGWTNHSATLSADTWYHVAASRVSGTLYLGVNGAVESFALATDMTNGNNLLGLAGGVGSSPNYSINGHTCSYRVTKGVGRYNANFTPPTLPLPTS